MSPASHAEAGATLGLMRYKNCTCGGWYGAEGRALLRGTASWQLLEVTNARKPEQGSFLELPVRGSLASRSPELGDRTTALLADR